MKRLHDVEFDWDSANIGHLRKHRVTPEEFEELITGDPDYLEYQSGSGGEIEERYKAWVLRAAAAC